MDKVFPKYESEKPSPWIEGAIRIALFWGITIAALTGCNTEGNNNGNNNGNNSAGNPPPSTIQQIAPSNGGLGPNNIPTPTPAIRELESSTSNRDCSKQLTESPLPLTGDGNTTSNGTQGDTLPTQ